MLPEACQGRNKKKSILITGGFCMIMLGVFVGIIAIIAWLQISGKFVGFYRWMTDIGPVGYIIIGFILIIQNYPFVMGYILIVMLTGLLYGFFTGLTLVVIASTLGWFSCFILLRYYIYEKSIAYIEKKGGYVARGLILELKNHQKIASVLIRIAPIPPGLQNAILAVSPITTPHFVWTSFIGFLFKQVPFTFIGSSVKKMLDAATSDDQSVHSEAHSAKNITLLVIGAIGTVLLFLFGFYISKRALDTAKKLKEEEEALLEQNIELEEITPGGEDSSLEDASHTSEIELDSPESAPLEIIEATSKLLDEQMIGAASSGINIDDIEDTELPHSVDIELDQSPIDNEIHPIDDSQLLPSDEPSFEIDLGDSSPPSSL